VILVVQEIFGVHEYIADTCRRFAKAGYLAIAQTCIPAKATPPSTPTSASCCAEVVSKVPDEQVMADLDGALVWAADNGGDLKKLAITGFCWGGRITWLYAAHNKDVKAGVAWYWALGGHPLRAHAQNPVDLAGSLNAPVLGLYGGKDDGIPLDTVNEMKKALAAAGKKATSLPRPSQFVSYPDTGHAFHADYRPSYRAKQAADGFKRALAWFKAKGVV